MWANAQRDGRPAEYRWRPLFNDQGHIVLDGDRAPRKRAQRSPLFCPCLAKRSPISATAVWKQRRR